MIAIDAKVVEAVLLDMKEEVGEIISKAKSRVRGFKAKPTYKVNKNDVVLALEKEHYDYLELLIDKLDEIVKVDATEIAKFAPKFDAIIHNTKLDKGKNKIFRDRLLNVLDYRGLRDDFYPRYFKLIGIKACVYCNSQLCISAEKSDGSLSAKFQVDHNLAKTYYPCFSISFYNLYPVCGSCNNAKGDNPLKYTLYSSDFNKFKESNYKFELDKASLVRYRINGDVEKLKIIFHDSLSEPIKETFAIEGIYQTQKDLAEELVLKSMMYNLTYRESLRDSLEKLYKHKTPMLNRLIIGNYTEEREIHKRPMSKFTMDIAKQLKLI